jgi:hypothetical protein
LAAIKKWDEEAQAANGLADVSLTWPQNTRLERSIFHEYKERITGHSPLVLGACFMLTFNRHRKVCLGYANDP